jgi:hypothetical protein
MSKERQYGEKDLSPAIVAYKRRVERALQNLENLDLLYDRLMVDDYDLVWVRITFRPDKEESILIVLKALGPDGAPMIAFVGSASPVLALAKVVQHAAEGKLRWRADDYAGPNGVA